MAGPVMPGRRRRSPPGSVRIPRAPVDWPAIIATVTAFAVVVGTLVMCGLYLYRAFELNAPTP